MPCIIYLADSYNRIELQPTKLNHIPFKLVSSGCEAQTDAMAKHTPASSAEDLSLGARPRSTGPHLVDQIAGAGGKEARGCRQRA